VGTLGIGEREGFLRIFWAPKRLGWTFHGRNGVTPLGETNGGRVF